MPARWSMQRDLPCQAVDPRHREAEPRQREQIGRYVPVVALHATAVHEDLVTAGRGGEGGDAELPGEREHVDLRRADVRPAGLDRAPVAEVVVADPPPDAVAGLKVMFCRSRRYKLKKSKSRNSPSKKPLLLNSFAANPLPSKNPPTWKPLGKRKVWRSTARQLRLKRLESTTSNLVH